MTALAGGSLTDIKKQAVRGANVAQGFITIRGPPISAAADAMNVFDARSAAIGVGVFYATREGHTRRVADRVVDILHEHGLGAVAIDVRDLRPSGGPELCSAAVIAASVHAGHHEREMVRFVKTYRATLESMPNAFLSVNLSEAGVERQGASAEERSKFAATVRAMADRFIHDTGWHPQHFLPVAGALLYTQYNFLVRMAMRGIARHAGRSTDTSRDHDYTDWVALERFVERFASELTAATHERAAEASAPA